MVWQYAESFGAYEVIFGFVFLQDTEIGKAVNGLRRHGSDKISKLAKTLFTYEFDLSFVRFVCFVCILSQLRCALNFGKRFQENQLLVLIQMQTSCLIGCLYRKMSLDVPWLIIRELLLS